MKEEERALLRAQEQSGKTIAAFSRERGIPEHQMYAMRKRAARSASGEGRGFVRVGGTSRISIQVSEGIKLEVAMEDLVTVLRMLGVKL